MVLFRSTGATLFLGTLLLAGAWAAWTIRFETEFLPVLPPDLPSVRGLEQFTKLAAGENEVFAVADPALPAAAQQQTLAAARQAWSGLPSLASLTTPGEQIIQQAGLLGAWILLNSPPANFAATIAKLAPDQTASSLAALPQRLHGAVDPLALMRGQLDPLGLLPDINLDPTSTSAEFLIISPAQELSDSAADAAFVDELRRALPPEIAGQVILTGRPVFNADISRSMRRDMLVMVTVAAALLVLAFWIFYRTLRPLGWIMFFQFFALLAGLLAARLFFGGLNVISIGFASILLGVGMDYSILVYHHFGSPHRADTAVWQTLRRAIWFSAFVTAAAFYFLALTSFPALQQLGVLVGTGLLGSALMATWPLCLVLSAHPPASPEILFRSSKASAAFIMRHRRLMAAAGLALLLSVFYLRPSSPQSDFYRPGLDQLRPVDTEAYIGQEWLQAADPSANDAVFVLRSNSENTLRQAAERITSANAITWNPASLLGHREYYDTNLAAWTDHTAARLSDTFRHAGLGEEWSATTLQMASAIDAAKLGNPSAFAAIKPLLRTVTGRPPNDQAYLVVRLPDRASSPPTTDELSLLHLPVEVLPVSWITLTREVTTLAQDNFRTLAPLMLLAILLLCALAQRSAMMVLLNLLALALSAALFLWFLRLTDTALNPLTLISLPLLVGLVVDYSLHVLMSLRANGGNLPKTYEHLAAPILLTGISACIGFGAPALTGQPALQNFGIVMDLGILSAVAACLLLLPPFFRASPKNDYRQRGFYRLLYRRGGFEWILRGWQLLGRHGAWLISRGLGLFYALTHPATVRAVRDNLSLLDPQKADFRSAARLFMNQAENFSTYGRLATHPTSDVIDMLGYRRGFEHLQRARDGGKGCLLVTGHLGFFELGGLVMAQLGFPMTALTLPEPTTALTEWRADFRARWGVKTIVVGNDSFSVLDIVRSLQNGAFVASLADRPYDGNSVLVDLPHGRIRFSTGPVLLALLAGCPIVPVGLTRQPDGLYHIEALDYLEPKWMETGRQETLEFYTKKVAAALVPLFAAFPAQWYHFAPLRCD